MGFWCPLVFSSEKCRLLFEMSFFLPEIFSVPKKSFRLSDSFPSEIEKEEKFLRVHLNPLLVSNLHIISFYFQNVQLKKEAGQVSTPLELVEAESLAWGHRANLWLSSQEHHPSLLAALRLTFSPVISQDFSGWAQASQFPSPWESEYLQGGQESMISQRVGCKVGSWCQKQGWARTSAGEVDFCLLADLPSTAVLSSWVAVLSMGRSKVGLAFVLCAAEGPRVWSRDSTDESWVTCNSWKLILGPSSCAPLFQPLSASLPHVCVCTFASFITPFLMPENPENLWCPPH